MKLILVLALLTCFASFSADLYETEIPQPNPTVNSAQLDPGFDKVGDTITNSSPQRLTNTWDGSSGTDWYNGANWSLNVSPTSSHDVVIPSVTNNNFPEIAGPAICNSLTINSGIRNTLGITTGALTVNTYFNCYGNLTMTTSSAVLNVNGDLSFRSMSTTTITANATINLKGNLEFQSGSNASMSNGTLALVGSGTDSWIFVYQSGIELNNLRSDKDSPYTCNLTSYSNAALTIKGTLAVYAGSTLIQSYAGNTYLRGDLDVQSGATFTLSAGTLMLEGSSNSTINTPNAANYFNHLTINKSAGATVSLLSHIDVRGNLTIQSGVLNTVLYVGGVYYFFNISLRGNWTNYVGPAGFIEGSGNGTVTLNGSGTQNISSENFCNLVLNAPSGIMNIGGWTVTCASYNWISGAYSVHGGTFTANDLVNPGIYGTIIISAGTVNYFQDYAAGSLVDLNCYLDMSGGTFNIHGGSQYSVFGRGAAATLNLSGTAVLDFKNVGIIITTSYVFTDNISGGTIRTAERFIGDRNDFNPSGGTIELYGSASCEFRLAVNSYFHNVRINKSSAASVITGQGTFDINGEFRLEGGTFIAPPTMYVAGNWTNLAGPAAFTEGTRTVTIDGTGTQNMTTETFYNLILNKSAGVMNIPSGVTVTCTSYDWVHGAYSVNGGTFTVIDLVDPGIFGTITLTSGLIEYYQDSAQRIDLRGNLTISGGSFVIHGGSNACWFSYQDVATLNMNSGVLDFKDVGIVIPSSYQFNENITGGTIRTVGDFYVNQSTFNPSGGTIELYGDAGINMSVMDGSNLFNLNIHKSLPSLTVFLSGPLLLEGSLLVQSGIFFVQAFLTISTGSTTVTTIGTLRLVGGTMFSNGNVNVNAGGVLLMENQPTLLLADGKSLTVNGDGALLCSGTADQPVTFTRNGTGYYAFNVESGASISAAYTVFEYMDASGIHVKEGASVDAINSFSHCTFRNGASGGKLLTLNNGADITITGAVFPANTWNGTYNVAKTANTGSVYFTAFSGAFSGPAFEQDPNNRIHWAMGGSPITDLTINNPSGTDLIILQWNCQVPVPLFNIYRSSSPEGPFTYAGYSTVGFWTDYSPGDRGFYRVTAVLP